MPATATPAGLIEQLGLTRHWEGGWFRRTFESAGRCADDRPEMSCILYMLTAESPVAWLHRNQSDIVHLWHGGGRLRYWLLPAEGGLATRAELGPDCPQLVVPRGCWKATELVQGEYALISEAVSPGWTPELNELASPALLLGTVHPSQRRQLERFCEFAQPGFGRGEVVEAQYSNGVWYEAKVVLTARGADGSPTRYQVEFVEDRIECWCDPVEVRALPGSEPDDWRAAAMAQYDQGEPPAARRRREAKDAVLKEHAARCRKIQQLTHSGDQPKVWYELKKRILAGDAPGVERLLPRLPGVDHPMPHSRDRTTPIQFAVERGQSRIVRCLLNAKANPDQKESSGSGSLLMFAATSSDVATAAELIAAGADLQEVVDRRRVHSTDQRTSPHKLAAYQCIDTLVREPTLLTVVMNGFLDMPFKDPALKVVQRVVGQWWHVLRTANGGVPTAALPM